ncbi:MAG: hypothetical protein J6581_08435 [Apibacter sp.]|nr:hypothetical protein [Apibacter sp.]
MKKNIPNKTDHYISPKNLKNYQKTPGGNITQPGKLNRNFLNERKSSITPKEFIQLNNS